LAGEKENNIINKAVAAYGGDSLMELKNLQFTDNIKHFSQGQSGYSGQGPMSMQLTNNKIEITLDLTNKRKVFKRTTTRLVWGHETDKPTVEHSVFSDGKGYRVDHALQQYRFVKGINYNNVDTGFSQWLDPLIIRQLANNRNNSQWTDTVFIAGQAHDVLKVNAGTEQEYSIFLNQKSGYLTRMVKKRGQHLRSYDFMEHGQRRGITWAKQLFVSTAEQPLYHTDSRELKFNLAQNHEFNIPPDYKPRPKTQQVNVAELTIRELAKGVYFVGQGWSYTLFIDAGDYYISAGAWQENRDTQAWLSALTLLRKTTGNEKPVKQHIVSHHHTDHMMGLNDVVKQGANLVLHPIDIPAVKQHLQQSLTDQRFVAINKTTYLADGKVMLFDIPNSHASHNLVMYLPEHKLLFSEDMFGSSYQTQFDSPNGWPGIDIYSRLDGLTHKINQLGLEVEQYLSSHHGRILSQAEIDKALTISRPSKKELLKRLFPVNQHSINH
jgi:glyoxylase-like metal-dependent hydrolase (beta-lactamase superfamily II)